MDYGAIDNLIKAAARRMQERAAAGWETFDSASIEWFPAEIDSIKKHSEHAIYNSPIERF